MIYKPALSYDDVLLVPKYSDITSRKEVNISSELDQFRKIGTSNNFFSNGYDY